MLGPSRTRGVPRAVTMESSLISKDESPVVVEAVEVDELGPVSYCELDEGSPDHWMHVERGAPLHWTVYSPLNGGTDLWPQRSVTRLPRSSQGSVRVSFTGLSQSFHSVRTNEGGT